MGRCPRGRVRGGRVGVRARGFGGPSGRRAAMRSSGAPASAHPGLAVYERHCATCHGATGGADGPGASALPIKPPPFTDGRLLNPLSDAFLATVVRDGAGAVGLAPQMPGFGRLLTEREIRDVVAYVRTLAQPPYRPHPGSAVQPVAPAPVQPIEFSHAIHAGSYGIDCQFCHADARRGVYAGLPSVARCMGCHKIVAAQGNPEVQKVHEHWNRKQAIPWVRIHKLAGFVVLSPQAARAGGARLPDLPRPRRDHAASRPGGAPHDGLVRCLPRRAARPARLRGLPPLRRPPPRGGVHAGVAGVVDGSPHGVRREREVELASAGVDPMVADSPIPLTPSAGGGAGVSVCPLSNEGQVVGLRHGAGREGPGYAPAATRCGSRCRRARAGRSVPAARRS